MPGIAPYLRTLAAGERTTIEARGTTIFVRATTEILEVRPRSTQVGQGEAGGQGVEYFARMGASEKWFTAEEFDSVSLVNSGGASTAIEILLGFGDFFRPVPDIVNVAVSIPAARISTSFVDETNIDVGQAGKVSLFPVNLDRTMAIITALAGNSDTIRIGDTNVDTDQGTPLAPGETLAWESTAECFACSEATADMAAAKVEHETQ